MCLKVCVCVNVYVACSGRVRLRRGLQSEQEKIHERDKKDDEGIKMGWREGKRGRERGRGRDGGFSFVLSCSLFH